MGPPAVHFFFCELTVHEFPISTAACVVFLIYENVRVPGVMPLYTYCKFSPVLLLAISFVSCIPLAF